MKPTKPVVLTTRVTQKMADQLTSILASKEMSVADVLRDLVGDWIAYHNRPTTKTRKAK